MAGLFAKYLYLFDPLFCNKVAVTRDVLLFVLSNDFRTVSGQTFTIQAPSDVILSCALILYEWFSISWESSLAGPEALSIIDTDNWISRFRTSAQDIFSEFTCRRRNAAFEETPQVPVLSQAQLCLLVIHFNEFSKQSISDKQPFW